MPALSTALDHHDFAETARIERLVIDKTTTPRDFTREVRWNQADYPLAQGL
jgi:L-arabinose isomerase